MKKFIVPYGLAAKNWLDKSTVFPHLYAEIRHRQFFRSPGNVPITGHQGNVPDIGCRETFPSAEI